jgi:antitoxin component YwqK of YwqJK toxin-antitoxin module
MKRVIYLLLIISFVGCQNPIVEKVEETYPDNQAKKISYFQEIDGKEIKVEEKYFHPNGKLKMGGKFLNGRRGGEWKAYFNNTQLQSLGTFKNGIQTGETKVYFPNGKLRYEGQYENSKEAGHWKFYNEAGKLVKEKDF